MELTNWMLHFEVEFWSWTFGFDIVYLDFKVDALNFDVELWKMNNLLILNLEFVFSMVNVSLWILGFTGEASWRHQEG